MVITDRTKYSEGIKSLLLDYIINLESKLKNCFKVLKNEEKFSEKESDGIAPLESLTKLQNFHLFY